ncbi:thiamine phosphate synthase [Aeromicrobium sp. CF4.19]|uniref:thiamine phosphate synthase n=1 Tax=Aeromicrobium sp. CF4.19 TaxID=3373082 RepID=UPI003EE7B272
MTLDLSVYLVTEPMVGLPEVVSAAVTGGVDLVQLRDKTATSRELAGAAIRLRALTSARGVPLVVNDDMEAARVADGIHVGADDLTPAEARATLGPRAVVGWSINGVDQLDDVEGLAACTYVAVSPVWATGTKPDHQPPLGLDGLRAVVEAVAGRCPVVGIGGIDGTNAAEVVRAGAEGVAVVSAICRAEDPAEATRSLRSAVEQGRWQR